MTIPIRPNQGIVSPQERGGIQLGPSTTGPSFADALKNALGEVSQVETDAQDIISAFVRGEPVEIHQVMAAAEEAAISLEFLVEIRNKLTEAYRTVINMQI